MKLAFICPRFSEKHAGGAEVLCRSSAIKLSEIGHEVHILSTCANNPFTWENEKEAGEFLFEGVHVKLFPCDPRPNLDQFRQIEVKIASGEPLSTAEEKTWIDNSLNSQEMMNYLEEHRKNFDFFIFLPYLFPLSIKGIEICSDKGVLLPCLHDENFSYLNCISRMFRGASMLLFNSPVELELAVERYGVSRDKCHFVAMGFEGFGIESFKGVQEIDFTKPFITYAGRREEGKNFHYLLELFRQFEKAYPGELQLVTMGSGDFQVETGERTVIHDLGFVSEELKRFLFSKALINCQPSTNESFSIILMESWLAGRPVLVNERCEVTKFWVDVSHGGLYFKDYFRFEQTVLWCLKNQETLNEMGKNGYYFVAENFSWDKTLERWQKALLA